MKKSILLFLVFVGMPALAVCPVENSVCTLPDSGSGRILFQNQNVQGLNMNQNSMPSSFSKTNGTSGSFNRTLNQSGIKMQGSLGCQFGNCNKDNNNDFSLNK